MTWRLGRGLAGAVAGYLVGAVATYALVALVSSNAHDRSLEAAMTAAFVGGPLGAVVGLVVGLRRRTRAPR